MPDTFNSTGLEEIMLTILAIIILMISIGSIYAFVRAIFLFIFSHGETEKIKAAWNSIRYMIIGIVLTIGLLFVFPILFEAMNVPSYQVYTASNIFAKAGDILQSLFSLGAVVQDANFGGGFSNTPSGTPNYNYEL